MPLQKYAVHTNGEGLKRHSVYFNPRYYDKRRIFLREIGELKA